MSRITIFLLSLPSLLQLAIFATFDLGVDEAHYVLYGRHLDLSYFDHPPLVGWVQAIFSRVLGENLLSARLPAILIGLFCVWQMYRFLREQGFTERAAAWGAFAGGICFQFFVLSLFLLPDTLLLAIVWPLMRACVRVTERKDLPSWLWLGFWLGVAGLSKYTAILFVVPVAWVLLSNLRFSFFRQPGFYFGILLAAIVVSPVLIWNRQHDWLSFRYQASHVLGGESGWDSFLKSIGAQFGLYSPFLWFFTWVGLWDLWKQREKPLVQFVLGTVIINGLFFFWSAWKAPVLPHWPMLFYLFTIPWGICVVFEQRAWLAKTAVGLTGAIIATLVVLLVSGYGYAIPNALKEVGGSALRRDKALHCETRGIPPVPDIH